MNIKIEVLITDINELKEVMKTVEKIEKEYSCNCTLLVKKSKIITEVRISFRFSEAWKSSDSFIAAISSFTSIRDKEFSTERLQIWRKAILFIVI